MTSEVLCNDCLKVEPYSDAKHCGEITCVCGGEFCGCPDCVASIKALRGGDFSACKPTGLLIDETQFKSWNETRGLAPEYLNPQTER